MNFDAVAVFSLVFWLSFKSGSSFCGDSFFRRTVDKWLKMSTTHTYQIKQTISRQGKKKFVRAGDTNQSLNKQFFHEWYLKIYGTWKIPYRFLKCYSLHLTPNTPLHLERIMWCSGNSLVRLSYFPWRNYRLFSMRSKKYFCNSTTDCYQYIIQGMMQGLKIWVSK